MYNVILEGLNGKKIGLIFLLNYIHVYVSHKCLFDLVKMYSRLQLRGSPLHVLSALQIRVLFPSPLP